MIFQVLNMNFHLGTGRTKFKESGVKSHALWNNFWRAFLAERTVFFISMATVIGPTPPGTGVITPATFDASSKFTSPTKRWPHFFVWSVHYHIFMYWLILQIKKSINIYHATSVKLPSTGLIPQSITTAPGFIQEPRTKFAFPIATTKISASDT